MEKIDNLKGLIIEDAEIHYYDEEWYDQDEMGDYQGFELALMTNKGTFLLHALTDGGPLVLKKLT